jgi:hypothetical protein
MWHHQMPEAFFPPCHLDELQSRALSDALSPMSATSTFKNRGGRAIGYRLSEDGAENAKQVRKCQSCWHCFFMKKTVTFFVSNVKFVAADCTVLVFS